MVSRLEYLSGGRVLVGICCESDTKRILFEEAILQKEFQNYTSILSKIGWINEILRSKVGRYAERLPPLIRKALPKHLVPFIALEMIEWTSFHSKSFCLLPSYCINFIESSFFTNNGKLDRARAAKGLVQDKTLLAPFRINIAIDYFLLEDISAMWKNLRESEIRSMWKRVADCEKDDCIRPKEYNKRYKIYWLHQYPWKNILNLANKEVIEHREDFEDLQNVCNHFLKDAKDVGFKNCWMAAQLSGHEYFLHVFVHKIHTTFLSYGCPVERIENFKYIVRKRSYLEIFRFLLYDDFEKLKATLLRFDGFFPILKFLLIWPNQDLFMKMVNLLWEKLSKVSFYSLLHSIIDMMGNSRYRETYNYRLLLKELWAKAPSYYRTYIFNFCESDRPYVFTKDERKEKSIYDSFKYSYISWPSKYLLCKLFRLKILTEEDLLIIKMMVKDISTDDKQMIIQKQGDDICSAALISGRPQLVDLFMECFVETESVDEYKQDFINRKNDYLIEKLRCLESLNNLRDYHVWAKNS